VFELACSLSARSYANKQTNKLIRIHTNTPTHARPSQPAKMSKKTRRRGDSLAMSRHEPGGQTPGQPGHERAASPKGADTKELPQSYYDNNLGDKQLMDAADSGAQLDDDDDQDERHQLIGADRGQPKYGPSTPAIRWSPNLKAKGVHDERHYSTPPPRPGRPIFASDHSNSQSSSSNNNSGHLLARLADVLGPTIARLGPYKTHPVQGAYGSAPHGHMASFVYQTNDDDDDDDDHYVRADEQRRPADGSCVKPPPAGQLGGQAPAGRQGSHWPPSAATARRPVSIPTALVVALVVACCLLLVLKLTSLVQDERHLLAEKGSSFGDGRRRQHQTDLVNELAEQLDTAHKNELELSRLARWLVSTPKCHIPVLEPWDKSILGFVKRKPPMDCGAILDDIQTGEHDSAKKWPSSLMAVSLSYVQSNRLYFTQEALDRGALSTPNQLGECCLKRVSRAVENDDDLEWAPCEPIPVQGYYVNSSIVEINCLHWNYTNVHSLVVHNQEEEEALAKVAKRKLNDDDDYYSVLMLGVDTISRLNGQRQLNRTLNTLSKLYQTLEFVGYNKVGENTFPNLIPLLTGLKPEQLAQVQCWQTSNYSQANEVGDDYLDNCKFLWNYFQQIGYLTYFGEDWPQASTFNYLKPGFKYEPTTFYGRPFTLARDPLVYPKFDGPGCASCQLDKPLVEIDLDNLKAFIENNINRLPYFAFHWINCPQHDDLNGASQFDHLVEKFFADLKERLEQDRTFVVFFSDHGYRWNDFVSTRVGHYESSLPLMTIAPPKHFIEHHPDLYKRLKSHRNALLTPFDIFKTFIDLKNLSSKKRPPPGSGPSLDGEDHEQPLHKSSPNTRTARRPAAKTTRLRDNRATSDGTKAVTPYVADTLTTVIKQLKFEDGTTFKQPFKTISLFDANSDEQLDRGCIEAGIPDNYCVCHQFEQVSTNRTDVLGAAYYLVYVHFESRLKDHLDICHRLDLERIHNAEMFDLEKSSNTKGKTAARRRRRRQVADEDKLEKHRNSATTEKPARHLHGANSEQNKHDYLPNREYSILISTRPGGGLFREVVRYYGTNITNCELEINRARKVIEDEWATSEDKVESVLTMNDVCDFSVHSESLSRFNLYKDQSRCVKSNIELKKICYCKDLTIRFN
jgi:hypothetical protein